MYTIYVDHELPAIHNECIMLSNINYWLPLLNHPALVHPEFNPIHKIKTSFVPIEFSLYEGWTNNHLFV